MLKTCYPLIRSLKSSTPYVPILPHKLVKSSSVMLKFGWDIKLVALTKRELVLALHLGSKGPATP